MNLLITGCTGFVGSALLSRIKPSQHRTVQAARAETSLQDLSKAKNYLQLDLGTPEDINLSSITKPDAVLHLAARAHDLNKKSSTSLDEYRKINVQGSLKLAREAARIGTKRFVFISSIGVNGNHSTRPFTKDDPPNPMEPYAVSKLEAEMGLRKISAETGLEVVIIRPPLVYGPGAPGNFARLLRLVQKGVPLPLGLVQNKRSLVAVDNLVDLILTCVEHPNAADQTFLVSDGDDLSTPELIRKLAWGMGKRPRLLPVPPGLLRLGGTMLGKRQEVEKLTSSLQVDIEHTCETLGWRPPVSVDEGLAEVGRSWTANHLRKKKS